MNRTTVPQRKIASFRVEKLFGLFDHFIDLETEEGLVIIHGPNGVGKSRILRMLHALSQSHLQPLVETPFESCEIVASDGLRLHLRPQIAPTQEQLSIEEEGSAGDLVSITQLHGTLSPIKGKAIDFTYPIAPDLAEYPMSRLAWLIEREVPAVRRVGAQQWADRRSGAVYTLSELVSAFASELPRRLRLGLKMQDLPSEVGDFLRSLTIDLVDTQRLSATPTRRKRGTPDEDVPLRPRVEIYAEELALELQNHMAQYGQKSTQLDRTFTGRALSVKPGPPPSETDISDKYNELLSLQERLSAVDLYEQSHELPYLLRRQLNETERRFLHMYLSDTEEKLGVFAELLERLELLLTILSEKFRNKQVQVSRDGGLRVATWDGGYLRLADLSSGEQHEIVLAYYLIFATRRGALVMIDEPEISLHVAWQKKFIPDLLRIRELTGVNFLIATHSPQIIGNYWDFAYSLGSSEE